MSPNFGLLLTIALAVLVLTSTRTNHKTCTTERRGIARNLGYFSLPLPTLEDVRQWNERTRQSVKTWIHRREWDHKSVGGSSVFNYGLPDFAFDMVNLPVGGVAIQHDLVSFVGTLIQHRILYLEIGVSVGKCLFTQMNFLGPDSEVVAMDIEAINPSLARMLITSEGPSTLRKSKMTSHFRKREGTGARLTYVNGDEFASETWLELQRVQKSFSSPFNLVLSDALHRPDALATEVDQLLKLQLLDLASANGMAMLWDDCVDDLATTFWTIIRSQLTRFGFSFYRMRVHGWLGVNEYAHNACMAIRGDAASTWKKAIESDERFLKDVTLRPENSLDP